MTAPGDGTSPPAGHEDIDPAGHEDIDPAGHEDIDPAEHEDIDPVGHEDIDPAVAELLVHIRDRFGLRGLRGARWMVDQEIALAESALRELGTD